MKLSKDLVALVTGGASGLGKATVERFIAKGVRTVFCDLPSSNGSEVAEKLGNNAVFVPADVASESDVSNVVEVTAKTFKKLDIVVNCAGIAIAFKAYNFSKKIPHKLEDFNRVLAVNAGGTFNVTRLALGLMDQNPQSDGGERGVIINTSGISGYEAHMGQSAFSASCGAINSLTLTLAREFGPQGIRVCTIAPGYFNTPLFSYLPEKVIAFLSETVVFPNRLGAPEEFAQTVEQIVENPYLNGCVVRLDGGLRQQT